ncbi:MAG: leucyl aminopeptidase family protein [Candidatus Moraniibacteriota bacterium]
MQFLFTKKVSEKMVKVVLTEKESDEVVRIGSREEICLGIGPRGKMTRRKWILLPRRAVMLAQGKKIKELSLDWKEWQFAHLAIDDGELAELFAVNALMADFSFDEFKTKPKDGFSKVEKIFFDDAVKVKIVSGLKRGIIIGEEVNRSRHIATMPGGEMTPEILAAHAKQSVKGLSVQFSVLDERAMEKLKMGGILGVGKGSDEKSCFIVLEYFGAGKPSQGGSVSDGKRPVVLVGKGVTFDTGGINLKPSDSILGMNMDMSGGAAVIHAIAAAARLKLKKNIIALIPAVENMPSGSSYRPGDVLRSMSGKTIEVLNTDAEGRIILADALTYAKKYNPKLVVDVATLTGAAIVALGERASALFTQDEKLEQLFRHLGEESGDYVWPLPLWDEYDEEIKGTFGDVANIGKTRWGGAITAAAFLKQFVEKAYPWVHLDIAPRMTTLPDEFLAKGSAGAPVRLLVKLLEKF